VVRSVENSDGVLIFDETIQEKAWTDENELMCWHYDHVSGRNVRGINLLNALYHSNGASIPVAFELVKVVIHFTQVATTGCVVFSRSDTAMSLRKHILHVSCQLGSSRWREPHKTCGCSSTPLLETPLLAEGVFSLNCCARCAVRNHKILGLPESSE
jgi:hypothetical protein